MRLRVWAGLSEALLVANTTLLAHFSIITGIIFAFSERGPGKKNDTVNP